MPLDRTDMANNDQQLQLAETLQDDLSEHSIPIVVGRSFAIRPDMDMDSQSEDGLTSLSDSTFEIISQSSFHTSDEDAHDDGTESLISFGVPTPDGSSIDGDEPRENEPWMPEESEPDTSLHNNPVVEEPPVHPEMNLQLSNSSLDASTIRQSNISTTHAAASAEEWIKFQEPISSVASGLINPNSSVKAKENQTSNHHPPAIKMKLAQKYLKLGDSFRIIFYTLHPELKSLKLPILEKIGQALLLSSPDNRSEDQNLMNVVPISAVEETSSDPEVMLIPSSGLQIKVEDFSSMRFVVKHFKEDTLPFRFGEEAYQDYEYPDLLIFVHPGPSATNTQAAVSLRVSHAMKRVGVPVLDICSVNWGPGLELWRDVTDLSQHLCHEEFRPPHDKAMHMMTYLGKCDVGIVRFPIDHATFQSLEAADINKNLAAMTSESSSGEQLVSAIRNGFNWIGNQLDWGKAALLLLLLIPIIGSFVFPHVAPLGGDKLRSLPAPDDLGSNKCFAVLTTGGSTRTASVQRTLPSPEAPLLISAPKVTTHTRGLTVQAATGLSVSSRVHSCSKKHAQTKKLPEFHLFETHDGKLFLQARGGLPRKWKAPSDFVHAVQAETPLDVSLSTVNETTFEILIGESRSCAPVILTVWPHKSETASQTFQMSRPCPSKITFQSIAGAYLKTLQDASTDIVSTTSDLWNVLQQHGVELYSNGHAYMHQMSDRHSTTLRDLARTSTGRAHQLNRNIENARLKFNSKFDEEFNKLATWTSKEWKRAEEEWNKLQKGFERPQVKDFWSLRSFESGKFAGQLKKFSPAYEALASRTVRISKAVSNRLPVKSTSHKAGESKVDAPKVRKVRDRVVKLKKKLSSRGYRFKRFAARKRKQR